MANMKLNQKPASQNTNLDIPDLSSMPSAPSANSNANTTSAQQSYVKASEQEEGRKLFANKKANIALIVVGVIFIATVVGIKIWLAMPVK